MSQLSIKKNRKAFTLIEILAVIVIMGILLLVISIPVTKYVENSKKKIYQSHEKELENATKNYMIDCMTNNGIMNNDDVCEMPKNEQGVILDYKTLVDNGYSKELEDPDSDGYCDQSYVVTNKTENVTTPVMDIEYKACLICSQYKTEGCEPNNLTCELEVVGTKVNGIYQSGVTVNLIYDGTKVTEFGMNDDYTNVEYNNKTSIQIGQNGTTNIFGYVKDNKGYTASCSAAVTMEMTKPTGILYMGYEVYKKDGEVSNGRTIKIENTQKYKNISGILVEFKEDEYGIPNTASGFIQSGDTKIGEECQFIEGRKKAVCEVTMGTYEDLTINFGNSYIRPVVSSIYLLIQEDTTSVWTNKDVMLYVKENTGIINVNEYSYDNGVTYLSNNMNTFSDNESGTVVLKDEIGNISEGYSYVINKIDKVKPTLDLTYSTNETSDGSLYISGIDYTASDTASGVDKIEYLEKDSSTLPSDTDTGENIISGKGYDETRQNKYVYFRAIDKAGNSSTWQRSNRYIGNQISIPSYSKINTGTIGDKYNLNVYKCSDSTCSSVLNNVSLLSNSFNLYNYGDSFYKFVITSSDNGLKVSRVAYLSNLDRTNNSNITKYVTVDSSFQLTNVRYIKDSNCSSVSASKSGTNLMYITTDGLAYSSNSDSKTCDRGDPEYGCRYCEYGYYDESIEACVDTEGTGQIEYECKKNEYYGNIRWVFLGGTYNVDCGERTKVAVCDYNGDGIYDSETEDTRVAEDTVDRTSCSAEEIGNSRYVDCIGWCESSLSYGNYNDVEEYYQYTIGVFVK